MDISHVYEAPCARALAAFPESVSDARVLRLDSGDPLQLRLAITDGSIVDIFSSVTGKYSYHGERTLIDGSIERHDHAPHTREQGIKTFPTHVHHGAEEVGEESYLSDDPLAALEEFLIFVRRILMQTWPKSGGTPGHSDELRRRSPAMPVCMQSTRSPMTPFPSSSNASGLI